METRLLTHLVRPFQNSRTAAARWAGVFMALAVTCLLSLIPMKIPAISPFMGGAGGLSGPEGPLSFWGHDAALHAPEDGVASSDDHLRTKASRRPARFGGRRNLPLLSALDPLAPQSWNGSFGERFSLSGLLGLYAGIRANPRIPVKRVRQIALPPPTPFNLRAPPAQA